MPKDAMERMDLAGQLAHKDVMVYYPSTTALCAHGEEEQALEPVPDRPIARLPGNYGECGCWYVLLEASARLQSCPGWAMTPNHQLGREGEEQMKQDSNGRLLAGLAFAGAAFFMCPFASHSIAQSPNVTPADLANHQLVKITFDAKGCPISVDPDTFDVSKSKKIAWQGYDASGKAVSVDYTIYFDPFVGSPHKSKNDGQLKSPPFYQTAPATAAGIEYKYSIVGEKCKDKPLDPHFRLR